MVNIQESVPNKQNNAGATTSCNVFNGTEKPVIKSNRRAVVPKDLSKFDDFPDLTLIPEGEDQDAIIINYWSKKRQVKRKDDKRQYQKRKRHRRILDWKLAETYSTARMNTLAVSVSDILSTPRPKSMSVVDQRQMIGEIIEAKILMFSTWLDNLQIISEAISNSEVSSFNDKGA